MRVKTKLAAEVNALKATKAAADGKKTSTEQAAADKAAAEKNTGGSGQKTAEELLAEKLAELNKKLDD